MTRQTSEAVIAFWGGVCWAADPEWPGVANWLPGRLRGCRIGAVCGKVVMFHSWSGGERCAVETDDRDSCNSSRYSKACSCGTSGKFRQFGAKMRHLAGSGAIFSSLYHKNAHLVLSYRTRVNK